jgi:hypothetical protein
MAYTWITRGLAASVLAVSLGGLPVAGSADGTEPETYHGPVTAIGNGHAHAFVILDDDRQPTAIGVNLSADALEGLPAHTTGHGPAWEYRLELPAEAVGTGYDHITVDWNPDGHIPPGVYDLPHFDFHFYLIDLQARDRITLEGDDLQRASRAPAPAFMPAGYVLPEGTAEPRMGAHAIDPGAPEFNDEVFTRTFIYGFHDGSMVFIEPMVTRDFLESRADVTIPVPVAERYQRPGYYPTQYRVGFDAAANAHVVVLEGLVRHGQTATR